MPGQAGEYSHDKRDETMTPLHGRHRQQLPPAGKYKNPLLVKPTLGNVKASFTEKYDTSGTQITVEVQACDVRMVAGTSATIVAHFSPM